jgi:DNA-binding NarL/FixJ family response regulator
VTAVRTKVEDLSSVDLTPLPEVTEIVAVGVLHGSRQHRAALVALVEGAEDLELLVEAGTSADPVAELARTMPDVAVVDADALGVEGVAAIARELPAIAVVAVSDDDGTGLGAVVAAGATSTATTSTTSGAPGIAGLDVVIRDAFSRRAVLTKGAAAGLWSAADEGGIDLPAVERDLLLDLAAGRSLDDLAASAHVSRSSLASLLATAAARIRAAVR